MTIANLHPALAGGLLGTGCLLLARHQARRVVASCLAPRSRHRQAHPTAVSRMISSCYIALQQF
ncbi:hypothetical protein PY257_08420 [Ramlibacter sp. H39-3-26]|uniref:hypothetical protein n=1 Tax=Curvibacter soli TaxID=3031331 RepID=UPI0023DA02C8|nr:hypothetical protein [Ramlibacter sp. H39-3-26]MDF1485204.1 hypothetical protein [Ramlibacter sp. H39-3-26]